MQLQQIETNLFKAGRFSYLNLFETQLLGLKYLTDQQTKHVIFGGGANGGKSWLGCEWLYEMCQAYPGTRYFIGRQQLTDMEQSTVVTMGKVRRHRGHPADTYQYNAQKHIITFKNGSQISLLVLKKNPGDSMYEKFGSKEFTSGWIEEAGEIDGDAFDILKSRVGRHFNDKYNIPAKILITCNPKKNWLYYQFYQPFMAGKLQDDAKFVKSLVTDNIYRETGSVENLASIKNDILRNRLLHGEWEYDDDPRRLMNVKALEQLFENRHIERGEAALTCDVARFGDDTTKIWIWQGWVAVDFVSLKKQKTSEVADEIKRLQTRYGVVSSRVVIDEDGVGGGVVDLIPGCIGFMANRSPVIMNGKQPNYASLKDQCWFMFGEKVSDNGVWIKSEQSAKEIRQELEQMKDETPDGDGKLRVTKKEQIKKTINRSPDFADALMLRMYLDLKPGRRPLGSAAQ